MQIASLENRLKKEGIPFEKASANLRVPLYGRVIGRTYTITFSEIGDAVQGEVIFQRTEALQVWDVHGLCDEVTDFLTAGSFLSDLEAGCFTLALIFEHIESLEEELSALAEMCDSLSCLLELVGPLKYWYKQLVAFALTPPEYLPRA